MANNQKKKQATVALKTLADLLKVNLKDSNLAIATESESATARMYDGSLEAEVIPTSHGTVLVETPRASGVRIELVDFQKDVCAPEGAIYHVCAYTPEIHENGFKEITLLSHDLNSIYIGRKGIILSKYALERAADLYKTRKEKE